MTSPLQPNLPGLGGTQHGVIDWPSGTPRIRRALRRLLPKRLRLMVPTIPSARFQAVEVLVKLRQRITEPGLDVLFDFSNCKDLSTAGVAYLGGLARLIQRSDGQVGFDWRTCSIRVAGTLRRSGLAHAFFGDSIEPDGHIIPYREETRRDPATLAKYLRENWLGKPWILLTPGLQEALAAIASEIYLNALEHGASPVGVMSYGEHSENSRKLRLSVIDFGVGIPTNVRTFTRRSDLRASTAMKWAFAAGTTTSPIPGTARGVGLDLLKDFVALNGGELSVSSGEGAAHFKGKGVRFLNRQVPFHGTLVDITFRCDGKLYGFASEFQRP